MKAILFECCEVGTVSSRRDHSARFSLTTQELTPEACAALLALTGSNAKVLVEPIEDAEETPLEVKQVDAPKTRSQRVRGVLFALWREQGSKGDFDTYYNRRIDAIIASIQSELDALK